MADLQPSNRDEREALSALLDGELQGDARRFVVRRLGRDRDWQDAAARWQLAGDVLRGRAVAPASPGFADAVAARIAAVPVAAGEVADSGALRERRRPARRGRWIGGAALAASVAFAAVLAVRPALQEVPGPNPPAEAGAGPAIAGMPASPPAPSPGAGAMPVPSAEAAADPVPARAVASSPPRAPAAPRPEDRGTIEPALAVSTPAAPVPPIPPAAALVEFAEPPVLARVAPASDLFEAFNPPAEAAVVTRPWPRALPDLGAAAAFTAGFEAAPQSGQPSFYPFEPRLPPELHQPLRAPGAADAQGSDRP